MKGDSYIIFEAVGSLEKELMGTAVAESLKKAYPERKIVVVCLFPDVWLHNPNVYRIYKAGSQSYFYDDYIDGKDTLIFRHDPYTTTDYAYARRHIIDIWCDLCGVPRAGSLPSLTFTWREKEAAAKLTASPKPLFFIHATGSGDRSVPLSWQKDVPIFVAQEVIHKMNKHGYQSVQIREAHQPILQDALMLEFNIRQTLCSISCSAKRLFIDSFMVHAATALEMPSVVTYTTGSPEVTGYDIHKNITAFSHLNSKERKYHEPLAGFISSYKEGYDFGGTMKTCPFPLDPLFDADDIVNKLLQ